MLVTMRKTAMQASVRLVVGCAMTVVGIMSAETRALDMRSPSIERAVPEQNAGQFPGGCPECVLGPSDIHTINAYGQVLVQVDVCELADV